MYTPRYVRSSALREINQRVAAIEWVRRQRSIAKIVSDICEVFLKFAAWTVMSAAIEFAAIKVDSTVLWLRAWFVDTLLFVYAAAIFFRMSFAVI